MTSPEQQQPLGVDQTYRHCPVGILDFETTQDLDDCPLHCGQERALEALDFGLALDDDTFNLAVLAEPGCNSRELTLGAIRSRSPSRQPASDWCYVFNFDDARKPLAIALRAGDGQRLKQALDTLIDDLHTAIPAIFDSEEYQERQRELKEALQEQQQQSLQSIQEDAIEQEIALLTTPSGFTFAPLDQGEVMEPEAFQKLPSTERQRLQTLIEGFQKRLQQALQQAPRLRKELQAGLRELDESMISQALGGLFQELRTQWQHNTAVLSHIEAINADLLHHAGVLRSQQEHEPPDALLHRYRVNLIVDHADTVGSPVVVEDLPSHQHLVGLCEHVVHQGTLQTDFSLIRPGALHRSNGGHLVLDLRQLLSQPLAWASLKRALLSREIRIESLEHQYGLGSTVSLQPEPIPLSVKVVLIGEPFLHVLLQQHDPEFVELFKVDVELDSGLARTDDACRQHARMLGSIARSRGLRPLDRSGVARMIEEGSRLAADQRKLSTHDRDITDLLVEANHWAGTAGRSLLTADDVDRALEERRKRTGRMQRQTLEVMERGILRIDTSGSCAGQINGLSVLQLGRLRFGRPGRITATAGPGRGQLVDIEREVKLGGPLHSKGVMILGRFIANRYGGELPLSLSASIAFEQSYGGIDGDSASVAETCALLSAISGVPLLQHLAVTGSIDQYGAVQAVGGVNEKIEGFFDACEVLGGAQGHGVIIPATTVDQLMLRVRVRDAIADGRFHLYAITHVDQALTLLTGSPAGDASERRSSLQPAFTPDSINQRVVEQLDSFARHRQTNTATDRNDAP